jgi:glycosyltransferase involved in cell wall biosynthesis
MPEISNELEIFIVTYNRADMLKTAIESCLQQTVKGISITILDNASADHTAEIVASFENSNIRYHPTQENIGFFENIKRSQQLCSKKYVLVFHDDDQLHPEYVASAYHYLEQHPDANLVVSNSVTIPAQSTPDHSTVLSQSIQKLDRTHFAASLYVKNKIAFCSTVYRKEALVSLDFKSLEEKYGKWGDRPIMIEAVGNGRAIVFTGAYVFTGRHEAQDTHQIKTQPPHTIWLNREKFYRDILKDKVSNYPGLCFCIMNHRRLKSGYKRRIAKRIDFKAYLDDAFSIGAVSKKSWRMAWLTPRIVQNLFNHYSARHLNKHFSVKPTKAQKH